MLFNDCREFVAQVVAENLNVFTSLIPYVESTPVIFYCLEKVTENFLHKSDTRKMFLERLIEKLK